VEPTGFDRLCLRLGRAAVLAAIVLVPLGLAEGAARLFYDPAPIRRVYDPFAYRIPQPGLVETFESPAGGRVTIRFNELGMRGPSLREPLPADALTLVFLGGSTTENYHLALSETFPELVGRELGRRLGRPVRVLNAGMSAATSSVSLARLQHQVLDLEPTLVVVMHAINDLLSGFHPRFRRDGRHLPRPALAGTRPRSYLLDWLRRRSAATSSKSSQRVRYDAWEDFPALAVFARNLRSMAAIAAAHGIPILFLTQATAYTDEPPPGEEERLQMADRMLGGMTTPPDVPSLARGMRAFNAAVMALPASPGVRTFDLAGRLPRSADLIFDECHLTREGNRRVAAELTAVIEEMLRAFRSHPTVSGALPTAPRPGVGGGALSRRQGVTGRAGAPPEVSG